ncbi:hypothetical protein ACLOJK_017117 [Asimina triloba]
MLPNLVRCRSLTGQDLVRTGRCRRHRGRAGCRRVGSALTDDDGSLTQATVQADDAEANDAGADDMLITGRSRNDEPGWEKQRRSDIKQLMLMACGTNRSMDGLEKTSDDVVRGRAETEGRRSLQATIPARAQRLEADGSARARIIGTGWLFLKT